MKFDENEFCGNTVADIEKDLRYIAEYIKQQGREILKNYTITPTQFVALQLLFENGDMTIGELSSKMALACSTTTDLVDRMEIKELVVRVKETTDRRVVRIHLLDSGSRIIAEIIHKRHLHLNDVLKKFSSEETSLLREILLKLHQGMQKE
jgi:MarR family transcriptional regulator, organic hydroperoxide resistance regulator